jgi:hypothetical protein
MDVGTFAAYRSAITWPIVQLELCKCNHPGRDRLLYKAQLPNYLGTIGLAADLGSLMRSLDGNAHAPSRLAHQVALHIFPSAPFDADIFRYQTVSPVAFATRNSRGPLMDIFGWSELHGNCIYDVGSTVG